MKIEQYTQSIIERLQASASVKTVYGEPVQAEGKTIIPVARVRYRVTVKPSIVGE